MFLLFERIFYQAVYICSKSRRYHREGGSFRISWNTYLLLWKQVVSYISIRKNHDRINQTVIIQTQ